MVRIVIEIDGDNVVVSSNKPTSPSPVLTVDEEKKIKRQAEAAQEGALIFTGFVQTWRKNFGLEGTEQPDRASLMIEIMTMYSLPIFAFIRHCGGLTCAVLTVSKGPDTDSSSPLFREDCRLIAGNIAQVSSILCPPLAQFLEYPWKN